MPTGWRAWRTAGYEIAATIENEETYLARTAERLASIAAEKRASALARTGEQNLNQFGLRAGVAAQAAASEITILRADYFESYAGQFLSVEARTSLGLAVGGPTLMMSRNTGAGTPISTTPVNMNKNVDTDTTPDSYVEHRVLVRVGGINSGTPVPTRVRIASSAGGVEEGDIDVWTGGGLPPFAAGFQQDFTTRYLDPTELYDRFESLAREFPNISQLIPLPHKTNGYQRKAQATMHANVTSLRRGVGARGDAGPRRQPDRSLGRDARLRRRGGEPGAARDHGDRQPESGSAGSERHAEPAAHARTRERGGLPVRRGRAGQRRRQLDLGHGRRSRAHVPRLGPRGREPAHGRVP